MNRISWRLALFVVSAAALATTGWSLFAVARYYQAPVGIAAAAVAVFDGIAYACLHLASEASANGRSAFGPRLTAVCMASVSVYLNITHAHLIHGGSPAAALFAVPTLGLLAVSEMAWAGPRAARRAELGERPYRPPVFGGIAWALAPVLAGRTVKARAVEHIEHGGAGDPSGSPVPARQHSATEVLRRRFAEMDPADAIRIAHDAQPDLPPADLAALLITYGVIVDAIQVALVLHGQHARVEVERADGHDAEPAPHDASQVGELPPPSKTAAIMEAASRLGPDAPASDVVEFVATHHGLQVRENYVRTVLSREARKPKPVDGVGQGGGGYA